MSTLGHLCPYASAVEDGLPCQCPPTPESDSDTSMTNTEPGPTIRISDMVRRDRLERGMTQTEYAQHHGLKSATAVSLWESGQRDVPNRIVESLLGRICASEHLSELDMMERLLAAPPIDSTASGSPETNMKAWVKDRKAIVQTQLEGETHVTDK